MFVFVYDFQGNCLANGAIAKMIGRNFIDLKDMDGAAITQGMINMVKARKAGWYGPYKFSNPVTSTLETKKSYCEHGAGETMVCVGAYLEK
ncbi:MAG: cache domain-containing protein [Betaproteobacteria bacterium]|nr:cache domain-containing protein [Betaproteobacteria bacterium]